MLALTLMAHYGSAPCPFRLRHTGREAKAGKLKAAGFRDDGKMDELS